MAFNAKFNFNLRIASILNGRGLLAVLLNTVLVVLVWFTDIPLWIPVLSTVFVLCGIFTGHLLKDSVEDTNPHVLDESGNEYIPPPTPQPSNQGITL
jgi:hypothetical protein